MNEITNLNIMAGEQTLEKILLLSCCAPCSCAVIKKMAEKKYNFSVVFYNPNIKPYEEYRKRCEDNKRVCELYGVNFIELEYDNERWCRLTKGLENEPERGKRCSICFNMRLRRVMKYAKGHGFTMVSSVLGVSRYKDLNQVNAMAKSASIAERIPYINVEGRKFGMQELRNQLIKDLMLYNQNYCGCKPREIIKKEIKMQKIIPNKLQNGDKIMIVAPSRGLKIIGQDTREIAKARLESLGLVVEYAPHTTDENWNMMGSSSVQDRVDDIMYAFKDKSVKAIFTIIGGFNSNQIISHLDYEVIKQNPKIICGFSDITALLGAINAQTGLEVYYGPHFSSLGMKKGCEYTIEYMKKILMENNEVDVKPSVEWSDDAWFIDQENRQFIKNDGYWVIHTGKAEGKIVGGNLCTFTLLLGTKYRPAFEPNTILFIEDFETTNPTNFDRDLQSLCYQDDFKNVKGLIIGRFQKKSDISREMLEFIINNKDELKNIPVVANVDFGHTTPLITIPLGGSAIMDNANILINK